jgi:hypothetical protein
MLDVISDDKGSTEKDLISKNIITGKGSTLDRDNDKLTEEVKSSEPVLDENKTYRLGSILAKAFKDLNKSQNVEPSKITQKTALGKIGASKVAKVDQKTLPGKILDAGIVKPVKKEALDIGKTYRIGYIFAKAAYDFNKGKESDKYKERTKIAASNQLDKLGIPTKRLQKGGGAGSASGSSKGGGLFSGITTALDDVMSVIEDVNAIKDTFTDIKDSFSKKKPTKGKQGTRTVRKQTRGRTRTTPSRGRVGGRRAPTRARGKLGGVRSVLGKVFGGKSAGKTTSKATGKVAEKTTSKAIGKTTSKAAGKVAGKVTEKVAGKTAGKVAGGIGKVVGKVGGAGKAIGALGKVAAPLALAVDGITAASKLSTEKGREDLRKQAEQLDYSKDFFGTLSKSVLSPIETGAAISLAVKDLISSSNEVKKSEASLNKALSERGVKSTEELYKKKKTELADRWDVNKDGVLDENEKTRQRLTRGFENKKSGGIFTDKDQVKWTYDSEKDKLISGDKALTRDEFLSLQNIQPQKPPVEEPKKAVEPVTLAKMPVAVQEKTTPTIPQTGIVDKAKLEPIKTPAPVVDIDLNDQNNLIKQQTNIMLALLDVSKKQLMVGNQKSSQPPSTNIANPAPPTTQGIEFTDGRQAYLTSPYSLG